MDTKQNYQSENIYRAVRDLISEEGTLRERVAAGYRYLLRCDFTGTKAARIVDAIKEITEKVVHGDWSKVSDDEINIIANGILELALNRHEWVAA